MRNKFILLKVFVLLLLNAWNLSPSFGQTWVYSNPIPSSLFHRYSSLQIQQNSSEEYVILIETEKRFERITCDSNLELISSVKGKRNPLKGKKILYTLLWNNEMIYFYSEHTSLGSQAIYLAHERAGVLVDPQQICELQNRYSTPEEVHFKRIKEKVIIWFEWQSAHSNADETLSVMNVNLTNREIDRDTFQIEVSNELLKIQDCQYYGKNEMVFSGKLFSISMAEKRAGKPNYKPCLIMIDKTSNRVQVECFSSPNVYTQRVLSEVNKESFVAAYLSSNELRNQVDSIHVFKYDLANKTTQFNYSICVDSLNLPKTKLTYHTLHQKYINLWIDHLITADQQIVLVLEFFESQIVGGAGSNINYRYYHGPVVIIQLDTNGKLEVIHKFEKHQFSDHLSAPLSSYKLAKDETGLQLILNESRKKVTLWDTIFGQRFLDCESELIKYEVAYDGRVSREMLLNNELQQEVPLVRQGFYNSNKHLVFLFKGQKYIKLGVLKE